MNPNGVAIDHASGRLFFTEHSTPDGLGGGVKSTALDGSNPTVLYPSLYPTGVSVVPATSAVYFTDNASDSVRRGSFDGAASSVVHQDTDAYANPANPRGVAVLR